MKNEKRITEFWKKYLDSLPENKRPKVDQYEVWHFCDSQILADRLVQLVLKGIKTATCGMVWSYEAEGEKLPEKGDLSIITDWEGQPLCIIETTHAAVIAFNDVGARHAFEEGEGDRSLDYWRRVHWEVFSRECAALEKEPKENMPLLCEKFRVLFPRIKKSG
jgi:uncharacterized protein YhfF